MNTLLQYLTVLLAVGVMAMNTACEEAEAESVKAPPSKVWEADPIDMECEEPTGVYGSQMTVPFNPYGDYDNLVWVNKQANTTYRNCVINGVNCRIHVEYGTGYIFMYCTSQNTMPVDPEVE